MNAAINTLPEKGAISPLRYPGSKFALTDYLHNFLKVNAKIGCNFIEPFAGGASISLGLLARKAVKRATIVERDPLVYAFWKCLKRNPTLLCERIRELDITIKTWNSFQKYRHPEALSKFDLMDLAVAGLFFNRVNYSGIIGAKPIGGMDQSSAYAIGCRFNKQTIITRISALKEISKSLTVVHGNALSYIRTNENRFSSGNFVIYIDPPYYIQGPRLYRFHFRDFQHRRLAALLDSAGFPWLVSYDNAPFIVDLFQGQKVVPISLKYTVRESRKVDELLISNMDTLPDPLILPDANIDEEQLEELA